ncbi:hypothetical protein ZIOFF_019962 [Zingiber officinale]|uniref:Uncharacterized protein n=1 Tax=Zingiber officinale TaxID=94328 RepID=A0A8J5LBZ1_ZINOF|nr:hypothetical protein ZIOFF_019962 [Zingiber officinale]
MCLHGMRGTISVGNVDGRCCDQFVLISTIACEPTNRWLRVRRSLPASYRPGLRSYDYRMDWVLSGPGYGSQAASWSPAAEQTSEELRRAPSRSAFEWLPHVTVKPPPPLAQKLCPAINEPHWPLTDLEQQILFNTESRSTEKRVSQMGGSQSTSSVSSWFCFRGTDEEEEREPKYTPRKVRPSDDDCCYWVGAPDVDTKASAFIAKFHEARFLDLETQTSEI